VPPEPAAELERLRHVEERLRARADATGFLRFDLFQEIALYSPGVGYYEDPGRRLGPEGDFYTAAHVHPLFGTTVADRILTEFERLGRPARFRVVELGPGDGTLARSVLAALAPTLGDATRFEYVLVERSASLREGALAAARAGAGGGAARLGSALSEDGPFAGVVLGNEVLDAQPTRRFVRRSNGWEELGVRFEEARWREASTPIVDPLPGPALPASVPEGTVVEVSPAAEGLLRELGDHLQRGAAVFLDYGFDENDLVRGRPGGTLQAVRAHRVLDDPLAQPGSADLSTFVNFTRVRAAARRSGLVETAYGRQAEALLRWGFEARVRSALAGLDSASEVRLRLAAKNLTFGFESFQVLELRAAD